MSKTTAPAGRGSSEQRPRRRDREQTIASILAAAEDLLERKGPDGFGLAELGREAGFSFGLIHHYFGGKEGLLRAVLQRNLREMGREIQRVQQQGEFWNRDAPAVQAVWEAFQRHPGLARLMAWGLLTGLLSAEDVAKQFAEDRQAVEKMIESLHQEMPSASRESAGATAALLFSAVLGFNLLRPVMVKGYRWNEESDDLLHEQLVRAMGTLAKAKRG